MFSIECSGAREGSPLRSLLQATALSVALPRSPSHRVGPKPEPYPGSFLDRTLDLSSHQHHFFHACIFSVPPAEQFSFFILYIDVSSFLCPKHLFSFITIPLRIPASPSRSHRPFSPELPSLFIFLLLSSSSPDLRQIYPTSVSVVTCLDSARHLADPPPFTKNPSIKDIDPLVLKRAAASPTSCSFPWSGLPVSYHFFCLQPLSPNIKFLG